MFAVHRCIYSAFKATPQSKPQEKRAFILAKYKERLFVRTADADGDESAPVSLQEAIERRSVRQFLDYILTSRRDLSAKVRVGPCLLRVFCSRLCYDAHCFLSSRFAMQICVLRCPCRKEARPC